MIYFDSLFCQPAPLLVRRWLRSTAWNPIQTATVKGRGVPSLLCQHLRKDENSTILAMFFYKLRDAKGVFMILHFTQAARAIIIWVNFQSLLKILKYKKKNRWDKVIQFKPTWKATCNVYLNSSSCFYLTWGICPSNPFGSGENHCWNTVQAFYLFPLSLQYFEVVEVLKSKLITNQDIKDRIWTLSILANYPE